MDLGILISTIITSTAALVAIIGGFLVSRIITLSGEKNAIQKKIIEIDKELDIKDVMLKSEKLVVEEENIDDFVRYYAEDILFNQKTIEDILEEDQDIDLEMDVLEPTIAKIAGIFIFLFNKIKETDDNYELPADFNEFIRSNGVKIENNRSWHELIYDLIYRNTPKKSSNPWEIDIFGATSSLPPHMKTIVSSQEYRVKVNKISNLVDDIKVLNALKIAEEDMLKAYGKISGLWGGLAVLIYACVVGIIIPSFLLPYPLEYYDDVVTRTVLLALFISELIILFTYLGFSMYRLTKQDEDTGPEASRKDGRVKR